MTGPMVTATMVEVHSSTVFVIHITQCDIQEFISLSTLEIQVNDHEILAWETDSADVSGSPPVQTNFHPTTKMAARRRLGIREKQREEPEYFHI